MQRLIVVLMLLPAAAMPAWAASPWDGEWEGQLRHEALACNPCRISISVREGAGTITGSADISGFRIGNDGSVSAILQRPSQNSGICSLKGRVREETLNASGACGADAELTLKRRAGSGPPVAVVQPPAAPAIAAPPPPPPAPPRPRVLAGDPLGPSIMPPPKKTAAPPAKGCDQSSADFGSSCERPEIDFSSSGTLPSLPIVLDRNFVLPVPADRPVRVVRIGRLGTALSNLIIGHMWRTSFVVSCGVGINGPLRLLNAPSAMNGEFTDRMLGPLLREAGYRVVEGHEAVAPGMVQLEGLVTAMDLQLCLRGIPPTVYGSTTYTVRWTLRDSAGVTLMTTTVTGKAEIAEADRSRDGVMRMGVVAMAEAIHYLLADRQFLAQILGPPAPPSGRPTPGLR